MAFVMTQAEIDRRTYTVKPHPIRSPLVCDVCGRVDVKGLLSHEIFRGRMYLSARSEPGFDPDAALAFCGDCWPRWLMWRARLGFDLHTHPREVECSADCIAQKNGRAAQLAGQMSLLTERDDGFFAQKTIDGLPRVNGSPLLMGMRNGHFMYRQGGRQAYYESVCDPAEVRRQFLESMWLRSIYAARSSIGMLIIVEAFESWYRAPKGVIPMPSLNDRSIGLHCVHLTHYAKSGELLGFWNNWGAGWGERGHGMLPYAYLEKYFYEAFAVRHARYGPPAWQFTDKPEHIDQPELRRRSLLQAPRQRTRIRKSKGENWILEIYETSSPTTRYLVLCVEVQSGFGLRMGWAFLRPSPAGTVRTLEIPELFVWPAFRRMGIGRMLDEIVCDYATHWKCDEIHLMMNEADSTLSLRSAARLFGSAMGYEWRWRPELSPRRPATGIKKLGRA
jgi:GNAT superfamily N-acetyltransferase